MNEYTIPIAPDPYYCPPNSPASPKLRKLRNESTAVALELTSNKLRYYPLLDTIDLDPYEVKIIK